MPDYARASVNANDAVLAVVRDLYGGRPIAVAIIRAAALDRFGIRYDAVNRELRDLVESGLLAKPERGYYEPLRATA